MVLFTTAARVGEIIPVEMLVSGIQELLEKAKTDAWLLDDNRDELIRWVELFAFSNQPLKILQVIDLLPVQYREYWRLRRLLSALGNSPHHDALLVLEKLSQRDARFLKDYQWVDAVMKVRSENSAYLLLNLICENQLGNERGSTIWKLQEYLSNLAKEFLSIRDNVMKKYEQLPNGKSKTILESIVVEFTNKPTILNLINSYASNNRSFDRTFHQAIKQVALEKRYIEGWSNAYEECSVSLPDLKKQLFQIVIANDSRSSIAKTCLTEIDKLRDEYGLIMDEPRHPDIDSGYSWPII
jgi:hypothetical protein